ncbi:MAG: hypothetical protein ABSC72_02760 [Methylovirgula sp.]|jgi:hypothetical protein
MPLSPPDRALGDMLVDRQILSLAQLDEAAAIAEAWNVRLGDVILSRNWIEPAAYYQGIAYHFQLPLVDLVHNAPDASLLSAADADVYARRLMIPWSRNEERIVIATAEPGPEALLFARGQWGAGIEFVVASKFDIIWAVQAAFDDVLSHHAVFELAECDPEMSARQVLTPIQVFICFSR